MGFRACKLEATFSGPYVHKGLVGPDERITEVVAAVRAAVGPDMTIMVDVQYAFDSVERALRVAESWDGLDVFFLETPLWVDDLAGYAELSARSPVPIAAGEWLSTRHDFEALHRPRRRAGGAARHRPRRAASPRRGASATWRPTAGG